MKRRLKHDFIMLMIVLSVPAAIVAVFPFEVFTFAPRAPAVARDGFCEFVSITDDVQRRVIAAARAGWQVPASAFAGGMQFPLGTLPAMRIDAAIGRPASPRAYRLAGYPVDLMPPTCGSGPAKTIPAGGEDELTPFFSREEMLKLN